MCFLLLPNMHMLYFVVCKSENMKSNFLHLTMSITSFLFQAYIFYLHNCFKNLFYFSTNHLLQKCFAFEVMMQISYQALFPESLKYAYTL